MGELFDFVHIGETVWPEFAGGPTECLVGCHHSLVGRINIDFNDKECAVGSLSGLLFFATFLSATPADHRSITLLQATQIVERATGGKILEAESESRPDGPRFEFDVVTSQSLQRILVSSSGRIQRNVRLRFADVWNRIIDRQERSRIGAARNLSTILATVERRSGGTAIDAAFEVEGGRALYEVELVTSIGRTTIYLDAVTGAQVLHVPND